MSHLKTPDLIAGSACVQSAGGLFNPSSPPLLQVSNLVRHYALPRQRLLAPVQQVHALNGVSLRITAGRSLGIVGESGSGKSTLARLVMALDTPTSGSVQLLGRDLHALPPAELRTARRDFQMVFQDPYGSLDPRQTIARAIVTRPRLVVADEPVSALDVSVQAQVLNLLQDLQRDFGITYLLISHDLAVVSHLCDEVAVLYQGRIVEQGPPDTVFGQPQHPYTRTLVHAVPRLPPTSTMV